MARPGLKMHPKFKRLVHILGEPVPHVLGYLECLWDVGYQKASPLIGDDIDIELAAEYPGQRGKLFSALLECRFIDEVEGHYQIHDLYSNAPDYVRKRFEREVSRKRKYTPRERPLTASWRTEKDIGGQAAPNFELGLPPSPAQLGEESPKTPLAPSSLSRTSEPTATDDSLEDHSTRSACTGDPVNGDGDPAVMVFPIVGGQRGKGPTEWTLRQSKVAEYRESYPGVDILLECRRARQWCIDNPKKRKTLRGITAFLSRWLGKAQDSGRGMRSCNPSTSRDAASETIRLREKVAAEKANSVPPELVSKRIAALKVGIGKEVER